MDQEPQDKNKPSKSKSSPKPKLFKEKNPPSSSPHSRKEETPLEMIRRARRELQVSQQKLLAVQQTISEATRLPGHSFREVKTELDNMKQTDPAKWKKLQKEYQYLSQRFGVQLGLFSDSEGEQIDSSSSSFSPLPSSKTQRKLIKDRRKWIPMQ
jgi:hypothetical protein